jgi:hypothetical protein
MQVDHRVTLEGLRATLVHRDTTTWSRQAFQAWPNHGKNRRVLCVVFFAIVLPLPKFYLSLAILLLVYFIS